MWGASGTELKMVKGDYGIALPFKIKDITLGSQDSIRFTFNRGSNGETVLVKEFSDIVQNTVNLEFTEEDSAKFSVGMYNYSLDWYQDGSFMDNLVPSGLFRVVEKVESSNN